MSITTNIYPNNFKQKYLKLSEEPGKISQNMKCHEEHEKYEKYLILTNFDQILTNFDNFWKIRTF